MREPAYEMTLYIAFMFVGMNKPLGVDDDEALLSTS